MGNNEISLHEIRVYVALKQAKRWLTNRELSEEMKMPLRTVSLKTKKFVELNICDMAEVFPGHRFKFSERASKRNTAYIKRLENALDVFGLSQ